MTLNPGEEYVISRQLNDPSASNTYYVQAVIRNAKTDAIIATVNLDNKGSQRFTKTYVVPYDPTGLGLYITITSTVYTDSSYTVKSTIYGIEQTEHLIQDRLNPWLQGVGGVDVDYKRIQKMINEAVGSIPKQEPKEPDLVPISEGLQALLTEIRAIHIPEVKDVDLRPVTARLEALQRAIASIEIPECDHTEVIEAVSGETDALKSLIGQVKDAVSSNRRDIQERLDTFGEKFASAQMVVLRPEIPNETTKEEQLKGDALLKQYLNG